MLLILLLLLFGCTNKENKVSTDPSFDIPKFTNPRPLRNKVTYPKGWMKKISINISPNMQVKDVLYKVASTAGVNVNLEGIEETSGISYSATDISFLRALKAICRLCGWRIKINNMGSISILKDQNYFYTHEVAFLLHLRKMKLSTNVSGISKGNEHSGTQLYSENELNLWNEIEQNLKFLLNDKSRYTLNKQGGLIIINATQAEHENIALFLRQLYLRVASQVFIQAKIIEVSLIEKYANGIDWNILSMIKAGTASDQNRHAAFTQAVTDIASGIDLLKIFGPTKTLSNPCTYVLNNQFAVFQCVQNRPYFQLKASSLPQTGNRDKNSKMDWNSMENHFTSEMKVIPIGVVFIVQPSIDFSSKSVTLCLKPTMSSSDKTVSDPAVEIMAKKDAKNVRSEFPIIEEKSIDTIINIKDGETAMVGGLIQKSETPAFFKMQGGTISAKSDGKNSKEIVMLVKVNIVQPERSAQLSISECEIIDPEGDL